MKGFKLERTDGTRTQSAKEKAIQRKQQLKAKGR